MAGTWIEEIQGVTTILDTAGNPQPTRHTLKFTGVLVDDDGANTVVHLGPQAIGGGGDTLVNLYAALRALGIIA